MSRLKKTKAKNKQSKRKSLSSLKIILPHSALYSITLTPQFFCKEGRVNRDVCYCFMAMKCGAIAEPPSDDPCAACLGPGFISIMRSIYSAAMTRGYEKKPDSFKNTGTSAKSCLKGRANSQMKLAWYVYSHKVVNCAREKKTKQPTGGQTGGSGGGGGGGAGKFSVFMNTVAGRITLRRWI